MRVANRRIYKHQTAAFSAHCTSTPRYGSEIARSGGPRVDQTDSDRRRAGFTASVRFGRLLGLSLGRDLNESRDARLLFRLKGIHVVEALT